MPRGLYRISRLHFTVSCPIGARLWLWMKSIERHRVEAVRSHLNSLDVFPWSTREKRTVKRTHCPPTRPVQMTGSQSSSNDMAGSHQTIARCKRRGSIGSGPVPRDRSASRSLDVGLPPDVDHRRCALRVLEAVWQDSMALLQCLGPWFQNSNCLNLSQGINA